MEIMNKYLKRKHVSYYTYLITAEKCTFTDQSCDSHMIELQPIEIQLQNYHQTQPIRRAEEKKHSALTKISRQITSMILLIIYDWCGLCLQAYEYVRKANRSRNVDILDWRCCDQIGTESQRNYLIYYNISMVKLNISFQTVS